MEYYIKGNAAKADKIKAAFEKLGYDVKLWRFTSGIYYTLNGKIVNTNFASNEYKLVLNNPDYKELELPVEPKFKVGDKIQAKDSGKIAPSCDYTVLSVDLQNQKYIVEHNYKHQILFTNQDNFELVPKPHYDIANFKPFDKVLVRDNDKYIWSVELFSFYRNKHSYPFRCVGNAYSQCIPYDGNEALLGTTDMPSDEFINW